MFKLSAIHTSLAVCFLSLSQSSFSAYIDSFEVGNKDYETDEGIYENVDRYAAINWSNQKKLTINSNYVLATGTQNSVTLSGKGSTAHINSSGDAKFSVHPKATSKNINALNAEVAANLEISANNIIIESQSNNDQSVNAIRSHYGVPKLSPTIKIGNENTKSVLVNAQGNSGSYGIVNVGGHVEIEADEVTINSSGQGVHVGNNTENITAPETRATTIIKAKKTTINAKSSGILAFSNGLMDISGDLIVNAPNVLDVRGYSSTYINQNGAGTVVLNGNINFETPGVGSGEYIDAYVSINLKGDGSSWTGSVTKQYPESAFGTETTNVTGLSLNLSNGATWNPVIVKDWKENVDTVVVAGEAQAVNRLSLNDGVINVLHGSEQVVEIENMTGSGGTINLTATTDGQNIESGSINIKSTAKETTLSVVAEGINADDIKDSEAALKSLNEKVSSESGVAKTNTIVEGDVNGAMTQEVAADGTTSSVQVKENTKLASMKGVNAAALVAWRDEVAYTNQRMEFLRDNSHAYGAWAQVYGGESSYDDASVDLKTTTVQVGADAAIGDWVAGAAFSYMSGDADMTNGQADTDAYTLSVYANRTFDSGLFVNALARYGRLSTDATAGNMDGSYDNNAFSIGGNVGYRITFAEQAFVEPMFGLQYAYVTGDDYEASNGVKVEQDNFDALIASLGARVGFDFAKDAGKFYARASVNHDFLGEIDGKASKADLAESMYVDLGGTWFTYGVGTQFNITDNLSVWGNLDRTSGGEVSTNYMMNAGLRYVF